MSATVSASSVPASEAAQSCQNGKGKLLDVRTPVEYREVHAEGTRHVPLDELDPKAFADEVNPTQDCPVYILCKSGKRASKAAEKFQAAGVESVRVVEGGTDAWIAAGLPVERGQKAISLERQVRITAGAMVFTGTILAATVSPWWLILPGFVGAGLVFAGITDFCGMGLLLAKMPLNR